MNAFILLSLEPLGHLLSSLLSWIANGLGASGKVLVDNGVEFDNHVYLEAMEQYRSLCHWSLTSFPWNNRTCERNHAVIDLNGR